MDQAEAVSLVNATFESSGAFLVRYAVRRVRSTAMAEDIVQEAFLALYRDLRLGKHIHDPQHWLFGAVRNQICKQVRSSKRQGEELVPTEKLDLLAAEPMAEEEHMAEAPLLLSVLTQREEEVILLRLQSLKYREIAALLGIGTKSVCTLLTRAIRKLQAVSGTGVAPERASVSKKRGVSSALH